MRAIGMVLLVAALGCQQKKNEDKPEKPVEHPVEPEAQPEPQHRVPEMPSTAEDENQLTPDEQKRFDEMVEGTSPVPECNELIRELRKVSACKAYPPQVRTMMQRGVLMIGELGETESAELAHSCKLATISIADTIKRVGC